MVKGELFRKANLKYTPTKSKKLAHGRISHLKNKTIITFFKKAHRRRYK
jgi:hypothetical protein